MSQPNPQILVSLVNTQAVTIETLQKYAKKLEIELATKEQTIASLKVDNSSQKTKLLTLEKQLEELKNPKTISDTESTQYDKDDNIKDVDESVLVVEEVPESVETSKTSEDQKS